MFRNTVKRVAAALMLPVLLAGIGIRAEENDGDELLTEQVLCDTAEEEGVMEGGTNTPENMHWNFASNNIKTADVIFMGEKEQQENGGQSISYWDESKMGKGKGDNGWLVVYPEYVGGNIYLMARQILPVPTYKVGAADHKLLHRVLNEEMKDYLFTKREQAVLTVGDRRDNELSIVERLSSENNQWGYSGGGNEGFILYSPTGEEVDQLGGMYAHKHKNVSGNTCLHYISDSWPDGVTFPVNEFAHSIRLDPPRQQKAYILLAKVDGDGQKRIQNYDSLEGIEQVYDSLDNTLAPASFDSIGACCQINGGRVVIRRPADVVYPEPGPDSIQEVKKVETEDWVLTVEEDDRYFRILEAKFDGKRKFTLNYDGAYTGDEECISVVVEKGDKLWYGKVGKVTEDHTVSFNLPFDYSPDIRICVMNETDRGWHTTDFCSNVVMINPPVYISFDPNGGMCSMSGKYAESNMYLGELPTPVRDGYVFLGWFKDPECTGEPVTKDTLPTAGQNLTLYAGWKEIENNEDIIRENPIPETEYMSGAVTISDTTKALYLVKGQSFPLPDKDWTSTMPKKVSISKKGILKAAKLTDNGPVKIEKDGRQIDVYVTMPRMTKKKDKLEAGEEKQIVLDYDKDHYGVLWESSNPDIATVSQKGDVKAVSKGTATITAHINGKNYSCKLTVTENNTAAYRTVHLNVGKSKAVKLKGLKKYEWTVVSGNCVEMRKGHKVYGSEAGTAFISTKDAEGKEYLAEVTVEEPLLIEAEGITHVSGNKYSLVAEAGKEISYKFKDVSQPVLFKSTKPLRGFDSGTGTIKTAAAGKTKLTAKINGTTVTINLEVK